MFHLCDILKFIVNGLNDSIYGATWQVFRYMNYPHRFMCVLCGIFIKTQSLR